MLYSLLFAAALISALDRPLDAQTASSPRGKENESTSMRVSAPPAELKLEPFYRKYVSAEGFPIVASERVNDYALLEAAWLVNLMLARRPDVRQAMIRGGSRMVILAHDQFTTDTPEHRDLKPKDFWDRRARGTGGSTSDPICSCGEENLLAYPGDPYAAECILIHEFAHTIHLRGMAVVDPTFDGRVQRAYKQALARDLWKGAYASTNHYEYFAEGVQSWFDNNRPPDHDHNDVDTREELKAYDSGLAALCEEVFGETKLTYTKPTTRLKGHLAGYDPDQAPRFVWPEHLEKIGEQIRREAVEKRQQSAKPAAASFEPRKDKTQKVEGWTVHVSERLMKEQPQQTKLALELLTGQLQEIVRIVPAPAVKQMQMVPLWFSLPYPGVGPTAEYHPGADWLREHQRDPVMARGVEFTNIERFEPESRRMPYFVLHELAHAFHDQVLGFDHPEIVAAYQRAVDSKSYDAVERTFGDPQVPNRTERAYAMSNEKEYFAETTEAFFGKNDFFPFNRDQLARHDPEMFELLKRLWETNPEASK
ncbi:MAG: hypothetical protein ACKV0T_09460 [Planctomycetales bacterium]